MKFEGHFAKLSTATHKATPRIFTHTSQDRRRATLQPAAMAPQYSFPIMSNHDIIACLAELGILLEEQAGAPSFCHSQPLFGAQLSALNLHHFRWDEFGRSWAQSWV